MCVICNRRENLLRYICSQPEYFNLFQYLRIISCTQTKSNKSSFKKRHEKKKVELIHTSVWRFPHGQFDILNVRCWWYLHREKHLPPSSSPPLLSHHSHMGKALLLDIVWSNLISSIHIYNLCTSISLSRLFLFSTLSNVPNILSSSSFIPFHLPTSITHLTFSVCLSLSVTCPRMNDSTVPSV